MHGFPTELCFLIKSIKMKTLIKETWRELKGFYKFKKEMN